MIQFGWPFFQKLMALLTVLICDASVFLWAERIRTSSHGDPEFAWRSGSSAAGSDAMRCVSFSVFVDVFWDSHSPVASLFVSAIAVIVES